MDIENTLFYESGLTIGTASQANCCNNLFRSLPDVNLTNVMYHVWIRDGNGTSPPLVTRDNAFDYCQVWLDGTFDHNAYLNGASRYSAPLRTNDIVETNFTWVAGPLGSFYQQTNSALINQGSRSAATAGLCHYTVSADQAKELDSPVDIGYHYVAVDGSGNPLNNDNDSDPDYLDTDYDGNGILDAWELVDVTKDLLLIYNTNSPDSVNVLNYYLQHRPMVSGANVLGIAAPTRDSFGAPTKGASINNIYIFVGL